MDVDRLIEKLNKLDLNNKFRIPPLLFRSDVRVFLRQTNQTGSVAQRSSESHVKGIWHWSRSQKKSTGVMTNVKPPVALTP
jgi:hypothetical protein